MLRHGTLVGRKYTLLEKIGEGELGEVWRARHERLGRECALKWVRPRWAIDAKAIASFLHDARGSGRLQHPNVVELLDQGVHDGKPYVVMPLLDAEKLERMIARTRGLRPEHAIAIVAEVAQGVAAAHEERVFHLRIEAANVLLHRDGKGKVVPKLIDFGIVHLSGDGDRLEVLSPIAYLAPEQLGKRELGDGRADVWALGVLLAHAVLGEVPFAAASASDLLEESDAHVAATVDRLQAIDPALASLVRDALSRDRAKRPLAKTFARRLRDLALRRPGALDAVAAMIEIPESIAPTALESLAPPSAPKPPPLPRIPAPQILPAIVPPEAMPLAQLDVDIPIDVDLLAGHGGRDSVPPGA